MPKNKGFTLIELLVVIVIIGLLSTIVMFFLNRTKVKNRDTKRMSDLKQIQSAIEMYCNDKSYYPKESENANGKIGEGAGIDTMLAPYIAKLSADPMGPGNATYYYYYDGNHSCINKIPDYNVAVLFARTMEDSINANWADVCNGPGAEGSPGINTYMIIIGKSSD